MRRRGDTPEAMLSRWESSSCCSPPSRSSNLWLLVQIGRAIGFWTALALVLATGLAGAWLAKAEGLRVVREWQHALAERRVPDEGVLSGVLVLAGGLLLVTPGVITDAMGLLLLFPPTRRIAAAGLLAVVPAAGRRRPHPRGGGRGSRGDGSREPIDVTPARERPER